MEYVAESVLISSALCAADIVKPPIAATIAE